MRESFILIIASLIAVSVKCSNIDKDGFNIYKDHLRARTDEVEADPELEEKLLYFYRTPMQMYMGLFPVVPQEYRKRAANIFKNHMLSRQLRSRVLPRKRTSKAALSLMMQSKQEPDLREMEEEHYCLYGK